MDSLIGAGQRLTEKVGAHTCWGVHTCWWGGGVHTCWWGGGGSYLLEGFIPVGGGGSYLLEGSYLLGGSYLLVGGGGGGGFIPVGGFILVAY